jgi:hypothetical protein
MREIEHISDRILTVRGLRVMMDSDLAALYGVTTKRLNEQVKRNRRRFPPEFVFRLSATEKAKVVADCDHLRNLRFSPVLPCAYTEHGALMASAVLNTVKAVEVSLFVIRAFVRMREAFAANRELARRLDELERKVGTHDRSVAHILDALRQLTAPPAEPSRRRRIGFVQD